LNLDPQGCIKYILRRIIGSYNETLERLAEVDIAESSAVFGQKVSQGVAFEPSQYARKRQ
jgi:hypothetical protein